MRRETIIFAGIAWMATILLAFMTGRTTAPQAVTAAPIGGAVIAAHSPSVPLKRAPSTRTPPSPSIEHFPKYVTTIPPVFRGRWDEIVSDKCEGREARFEITGTTIANFEVQSDVEKVKLYNPTEADISITGYDEDKNQYNSVMTLKVVDNGHTLTGRSKDAPLFHKCPS